MKGAICCETDDFAKETISLIQAINFVFINGQIQFHIHIFFNFKQLEKLITTSGWFYNYLPFPGMLGHSPPPLPQRLQTHTGRPRN